VLIHNIIAVSSSARSQNKDRIKGLNRRQNNSKYMSPVTKHVRSPLVFVFSVSQFFVHVLLRVADAFNVGISSFMLKL
jgi:hypothetical protein